MYSIILSIVDPLPANAKIMAIDLSMGNQSHGAILSFRVLAELKFKFLCTENLNFQGCKLLISTYQDPDSNLVDFQLSRNLQKNKLEF